MRPARLFREEHRYFSWSLPHFLRHGSRTYLTERLAAQFPVSAQASCRSRNGPSHRRTDSGRIPLPTSSDPRVAAHGYIGLSWGLFAALRDMHREYRARSANVRAGKTGAFTARIDLAA